MPDFLHEVLIRLSVMLPAVLIASALLWYVFRLLGIVRKGAPVDPRDMRTWPLRFALADATLFAITFAVVIVFIGESQLNVAVAGGVAAIAAVGLGPFILQGISR
jgi:hypothetical protein